MPRHNYDSDDEFGAEGDPHPLPGTLVDPVVLNKHLGWMASHPGEPATFHARTGQLVPWLWPAEGPGHVAVEPRSLPNIIKTKKLALPLCFCVVERDGEKVSNSVELVKRDKVLVFKCRSSNGCGYYVSLDKWNPRVVKTEDLNSLIGNPDLNFVRAGIYTAPDETGSTRNGRRSSSESSLNLGDDFAALRSSSGSTSSGRSSSPISGSSAGPSRGKGGSSVRHAPYNITDRGLLNALTSPPRNMIERERRQYTSLAGPAPFTIAPAPAEAPVVAASEFRRLASFEVDEIPTDLLYLSNMLAKEGLTQAQFNKYFGLTDCGHVVFRGEINNGHLLACDQCRGNAA